MIKLHKIVKKEEIEDLKAELKRSEDQLQELTLTKNEYIGTIEEFNTQYSIRLGNIIRKVLSLKRGIPYRQVIQKVQKFDEIKSNYQKNKIEYEELKREKESLEIELDKVDEFDDLYDEIYYKLQEIKDRLAKKESDLDRSRELIKESKDEIKRDPAHQEYQETKQEYEEFKDEYSEILSEDRYDISSEEKRELKILFKRGVKLCHPDIVEDHLKDKAQIIIQELNSAYKKRDIEKVKDIISHLEDKNFFDTDDSITDDKHILKLKIADIKKRIKETLIDIEEIKDDESYVTIQEIDDWDRYFDEIHDTLQEEYDRLKEELFKSI